MIFEKVKERLRGANVLLPTPFAENYDLDLEALRGNVEFMLERGLREGNAILKPTSSEGEFPLMSTEEQKKVIKTVIDAANGKIPVVPGTFHVRFDRTVELSRYAKDAGAEAVMILPSPYYSENLYKIDRDKAVIDYFKELVKQVDIPFMIYNQPRRNGLEIPLELFDRLAKEIPNFIATQDCVNDSTKMHVLIRRLSDRLSIHACSTGEEGAPSAILAGASGFVSNIGNFAPEFSSQIFELSRTGEYDEAVMLARQFTPIYELLYKYPSIALVKSCMDLVGGRQRRPSGGNVRKPLRRLDGEEVEDVKRALLAVSLIAS